MFPNARRTTPWLGAAALFLALAPHSNPAHAQRWDPHRPDRWQQQQWERQRHDMDRRAWEHKRRDDARTAGVVAGVVGTAVLVGVIAAAANRDRDERARADYCVNRYGNYDRATDTYRAPNGYTYRCE